jgi:FkbM family methyltransferase
MTLLPKFIRDLRYKLFYGLLLQRGHELQTLGAPGSICKWTICPRGLHAGSIVYSGGVGTDISFEQELVKRYGCRVILLDPSPSGIQTMALPENQIPQFKFFPLALTAGAGSLKMGGPADGSWHASEAGQQEVPSTDLAALMKQNGHTYIDLLKLDIEGCEYEVIDDVLENRIPVRQLCADFDYGYVPGVRRSQAIRAILRLKQHGYQLICQEGANHTFLNTRFSAAV